MPCCRGIGESVPNGRRDRAGNATAAGGLRSAAMVLSDQVIRRLIEAGRIGIAPYDPALMQPSSLDVRVDTLHEIMVNKITTLISRCEVKDIVDLYFLEKAGLRVERHFEEARQKDGGLDPGMVSLLLDSVTIAEVPDYMIQPLDLEELRAFVDDLKRRMALMAYPDAD